jgi:hypothetical protein
MALMVMPWVAACSWSRARVAMRMPAVSGGDAVRLEDRGDAADGEADGGLVGAEQFAEQPVGHAEAVVAGGGGDDGLEGELPGGAAAVLGAGGAAGQVQPVVAGGVPGRGDGGEQGAEVGDAGQGGQSFQVRAGCRCWLRFCRGGEPDRVVPLAVEGIACSSRYRIRLPLTFTPSG